MATYNKQLLVQELTRPVPSIESIAGRATGRSTGLALRAISAAILSPGRPVLVPLHDGEPEHRAATNSREALVVSMIERLGLDMTVTREQSSVYVRSDFAVSL